jgi:hypothetical protein
LIDFFISLFDPIILTAIATVIGTGLLVLAWLNKRQANKKPRIEIKKISIKPWVSNGGGSFMSQTYISVDIFNPSNFENLILSRSLKILPFGELIVRYEANIPLPKFGKYPMRIDMEYNLVNKYKNWYAILTLTDIKRRRIRKIFKLTDNS